VNSDQSYGDGSVGVQIISEDHDARHNCVDGKQDDDPQRGDQHLFDVQNPEIDVLVSSIVNNLRKLTKKFHLYTSCEQHQHAVSRAQSKPHAMRGCGLTNMHCIVLPDRCPCKFLTLAAGWHQEAVISQIEFRLGVSHVREHACVHFDARLPNHLRPSTRSGISRDGTPEHSETPQNLNMFRGKTPRDETSQAIWLSQATTSSIVPRVRKFQASTNFSNGVRGTPPKPRFSWSVQECASGKLYSGAAGHLSNGTMIKLN